MVPYRSFHICRTWRSLPVGGRGNLKSLYRMVGTIHKWVGQFFLFGGGGGGGGGGVGGGVDLSRQHVKIFILQLGKGLIEQNG